MRGGEFSPAPGLSPDNVSEHVAHVEGVSERRERRSASIDHAVLDEIYGDLIDQIVTGQISEAEAEDIINSLNNIDN